MRCIDKDKAFFKNSDILEGRYFLASERQQTTFFEIGLDINPVYT